MSNQKHAEDLTVAVMKHIMRRFKGNTMLQQMSIMPLMQFDIDHLQPVMNGTYTHDRETYMREVELLMEHLATVLNNIYDKFPTHNTTREAHTAVFVNVWPDEEE